MNFVLITLLQAKFQQMNLKIWGMIAIPDRTENNLILLERVTVINASSEINSKSQNKRRTSTGRCLKIVTHAQSENIFQNYMDVVYWLFIAS